MYGLINNALHDMIVMHHDESTWKQIHEESGVTEDVFLTMRRYDDESTYLLVGAASEVLGAPVEDCLVMFGKHWVAEVATKNFETLMDTTGTSTVTFLQNLNALHDRITSTFLDYIPPQFQVEELGEDRYRVDYYSQRKSLTPFVTGLLQGLAEHYGDELNMISLTTEDDGEGTHSVYELKIQ